MKTVIIIKSGGECVFVLDVYFTKYGFLFLLLWLIISIYDIIFVFNAVKLGR